jgi:hypothetical protein
MRWGSRSERRRGRGQALTEFALVAPIFLLALFSVIILSLYVFYQQQLDTAAREAARYAAIHSSSAQCPTTSWLSPGALAPPPTSYYACDPAPTWPFLTAAGRTSIWGTNPSFVQFRACWSSYRNAMGNLDAPPIDPSGTRNTFVPCTIVGVNPTTNESAIPCPPGNTTSADDTGSDNPDNQVTVFACFNWTPPMAGFVMIPSQITMRSVVTEVIHQQQ